MTSDHRLGKEGEKLAFEYLKTHDFLVLKQNWRSGRFGEIDLIAKDLGTNELVFIEVKSRSTSTDDAKELVTKNKQKRLYKLAHSYLYSSDMEDSPCRFDVIAIRINEKDTAIEHIKNAFYLS